MLYLDTLIRSVTLQAATRTSTILPEGCESLYRTAAARVRDYNVLVFSFTLETMIKTGVISPEAFESGRLAAAAMVHYIGAQTLSIALSHCGP